ncbi:MAG: YlxR family protein [Actinomycetota bacterium]
MAPVRTCIGCRTRHPATDLVRCALGHDGRVTLDRTGPGRGAWLHPDQRCLDVAKRRRAFDRAFRTKVGDEALDGIEQELETSQRACGA